MQLRNALIISFLCLGAAACGNGESNTAGANVLISKYGNASATPHDFSICYGNGCKHKAHVSLSRKQWNSSMGALQKKAKSSEEERQHIAHAIGALETLVGKKTNTAGDVGGSFATHASDATTHSEQMDCVDEAVNTSTYLRMMENEELIQFHTIMGPTWRGYMIGGWPHTAMVIRDNDSGEQYVVDSWFLDNGKPASIVKLDEWKSGWSPTE